MTPLEHFHAIGDALQGASPGQFFGKPCYKVGGKPFVAFFQDAMVFKVTGEAHAGALAAAGAVRFDPSGQGRSMKECVQGPAAHAARWPVHAQAALEYVQGLPDGD